MRRVVMFSGGIASWAAARRLADVSGIGEMTLLFCDTMIEDEDTYRFLDEAAADIRAPLVRLADGRDVWQVFRDERMLGNSRIDPCSKILKREIARKWMQREAPGATVVVGIDWSEAHRLPAIVGRYGALGFPVEAPLMDAPYLTRTDMFRLLAARGIQAPRLYAMQFSHGNCGGFCVKAGMGHFARLLKAMPERYAYHEGKEQEMRDYLGRDVAILKRDSAPLTLRALRQQIEAGRQVDMFDIGGCGCFIDADDEVSA